MKSPCFLGKNGWQKDKPRPTLYDLGRTCSRSWSCRTQGVRKVSGAPSWPMHSGAELVSVLRLEVGIFRFHDKHGIKSCFITKNGYFEWEFASSKHFEKTVEIHWLSCLDMLQKIHGGKLPPLCSSTVKWLLHELGPSGILFGETTESHRLIMVIMADLPIKNGDLMGFNGIH